MHIKNAYFKFRMNEPLGRIKWLAAPDSRWHDIMVVLKKEIYLLIVSYPALLMTAHNKMAAEAIDSCSFFLI